MGIDASFWKSRFISEHAMKPRKMSASLRGARCARSRRANLESSRKN